MRRRSLSRCLSFTSFSLESLVTFAESLIVGRFGYLFESFFRTRNVAESYKMRNLEARRESPEFREEALKKIYVELKPQYFFWIVRCLLKVSNKNTKAIFQIQLTLRKYGLSNSGLDFLNVLGDLPTRRTFSNQLKKHLRQYKEACVSLAVLCFIWIDNFARFLKHFLLSAEHGSAQSNQYTAIAFKRVGIPFSKLKNTSWPTLPCGELVADSLIKSFKGLWIQLVDSNFDLYSTSYLARLGNLQVPLKMKVLAFK